MKTRNMVGAFLTYQDKVLLMHRSMQKKIAPGMWSCIGGHIEPQEINTPLEACYREIAEEAQISQECIKNLHLRYITTRNAGDEIRSGYYFVGEVTQACSLPQCDEGTLHWISLRDALEKPMSFSVKQITTHWIANPGDDALYLCGVNRENDTMEWVAL